MTELNLTLWEMVKSPDPKYTKTFNRAGGFKGTATNTQYQIMAATKVWGPNGVGWGYEITDEKYVEGAAIDENNREIIHVIRGRVWFVGKDGTKYYTSEQFGQTQFVGKNKYGAFTDEEAPKKSVSDMLLKCLALLGFSADIFLGLYDDNKYVAAVQQNANNGQPSDTITEAQEIQLRDLLSMGKTYTEKTFLGEAKVARLSDLKAAKFDGAWKHVQTKIAGESA